MNDKDRLAGFRALLKSDQTNDYHLIEPDGEFRLWQDLSAEGKVETIARDASFYGVTFEQFAEAVRESVDTPAIEEAALRLAMRSSRELYELEKLLPSDGRLEPAPPLIERFNELLNAKSSEHESWLTPEEQRALFEEMRADEAAAKREDAHRYGKMTLQDLRDEKTKSPTAEKGKHKGMDR